MTPKARTFWPLLLVLFLTDCTTKELAVEHLDPAALPRTIVDPFLRLTLVHNPGAAFGFDLRPYLGSMARPVLILMMVIVFSMLVRLYWTAAPRARLTAAALGLACGGALGNMFDRLRYSRGVVDFIDLGTSSHRFFTFNVADAGISIGAVLLAITLLREESSAAQPSQVASS